MPLKISNNAKHIKDSFKVGKTFTPEEKTKLAKAAKDFESLLTSMMLKSMNKTTGGMFGENSYGGDILDSVFENEIASNISKKKSLGIADVLFKKITGEKLTLDMLPKTISPSANYARQIKSDVSGITPSTSARTRLANYEGFINNAAQKFGVDKNLIKSIILTESAANEKAVSKANAKGLMQLMDGTAADMNVKNSFDPEDNINGGTKYISKMLQQYDGNLEKALAAYNAGPGNVDKYNGIPPFKETQNYVSRVLGYYKSME
ncbi:MAG: transglycosylase SLT domain-containing protein [Rhodothermaceae bacterium]